MLLLIMTSMLAGAAITLAVLLYITVKLIGHQGEKLDVGYHEQFTIPSQPQVLKTTNDNHEPANEALNNLLAFFFQEMKNTTSLRGWMRDKILHEFTEIMKSRALQVVVAELSLRSFDLGSSLPSFTVKNVINSISSDKKCMETVDAIVELSYSGGFRMVIEVLLSIRTTTSLVLVCSIERLSGTARLRFTRLPYTNWSFAFTQEPVVEIDIQTQIDGRNVPQVLVPLLKKQIKRVLRKKHTLPNHKLRVGPFFRGCTQDFREVAENAEREPVTSLLVTVVGCSRLVIPKESSFIYCILQLDESPYKPEMTYIERVLEMKLSDLQNKNIGLTVDQVEQPISKQNVPAIIKIEKGSAGGAAGLKEGDVITSVNGVSIDNAKQAEELITATQSRPSITLHVLRYEPELRSERSTSVRQQFISSQSEGTFDSLQSSSYLPSKLSNLSFNRNKQRESRSPSKENFRVLFDTSLTSTVTCDHLIKTSHKKTTYVKSSPSPLITERFIIQIKEAHVYLNVCIFSQNKHSKDSLVGYASYSLHDIIAECAMTLQGDTMLSMSLTPPPDLTYIPTTNGAKATSAKCCYGDITMRFAKNEGSAAKTTVEALPSQQMANNHDDFVDIDVQAEVKVPHDKMYSESSHDFQLTQFQRAVICHTCTKKIWLKKALRCSSCGMICHRKCLAQCQSITKCDGDGYSWTSEFSDLPRAPSRLASAGDLIQRLLRKDNKASAPIPVLAEREDSDQTDDGSIVEAEDFGSQIPDMPSLLDTDESDSSDDDAKYNFIQYLKNKPADEGNASDVATMKTAKEMGRQLFNNLGVVDRRDKLEHMVEKLQQEIEMVSIVRQDLAMSHEQANTATQKKVIRSQLDKADEKLQALAVLLIHYHSGLEHCTSTESSSDNLPDIQDGNNEQIFNQDEE